MSKVLILANNDVGLYKFRKELIQELLKDNKVIISLPYGELVEPLKEMGCQFINTSIDRRGINPITDIGLIFNYLRILRKERPDIVIAYTIKPNIYGSLIASFLNIPYYVNITGLGTAFQSDNFLRKIIVFLYKISLRKVKKVFFENMGNRDIFVNEKIIHKDKTIVLNGAGVNLDDYPLTRYPDENEDIHFLFIGRIMKEKGIDELLYSAKKLKNKYSNIQFDIVGPMEEDYKDVIDEYINNNIINYYGFQKDVKPFIERCHCFVLPSYHEGMANTLLESAAMGRPLITSNIHGCLEAINNNGYLVNVKDKDDLYEKLEYFIELPYEEKKTLGINSRKHMEEMFDKKKVVEETIKGLKI